MPLAREQRKLAAIVAADVVGYSRLMGRDEPLAHSDRSSNTAELADILPIERTADSFDQLSLTHWLCQIGSVP